MTRILYETTESFAIAFAQIAANKMRSVLTALGVIIGIVAVTLTGSERAGSVTYTLPMAGGWATLPIDHVLVPRGRGSTSALRLPLLGSDHHGVLAGFALAG